MGFAKPEPHHHPLLTQTNLKRELYEVLERYTEAQSGTDDYLLRLGMAPLTGDS